MEQAWQFFWNANPCIEYHQDRMLDNWFLVPSHLWFITHELQWLTMRRLCGPCRANILQYFLFAWNNDSAANIDTLHFNNLVSSSCDYSSHVCSWNMFQPFIKKMNPVFKHWFYDNSSYGLTTYSWTWKLFHRYCREEKYHPYVLPRCGFLYYPFHLAFRMQCTCT